MQTIFEELAFWSNVQQQDLVAVGGVEAEGRMTAVCANNRPLIDELVPRVIFAMLENLTVSYVVSNKN